VWQIRGNLVTFESGVVASSPILGIGAVHIEYWNRGGPGTHFRDGHRKGRTALDEFHLSSEPEHVEGIVVVRDDASDVNRILIRKIRLA